MQSQNSEPRSAAALRWRLRIIGVFLLVASWFIVTFPPWGDLTFLVNSLIFACLGAFGMAAAYLSRKEAVALERRLRLQLIVHNMELENMSLRDDLTNLFNRRSFFDRLERELETAKGLDRPLALILINIDSLQGINEAYGHRVGDRVLAAFGSFLMEHTRAADILARTAGSEFAIILPDTTKRVAYAIAERLTARLAAAPIIDEPGLTLHVSASFGISGYPWGGDDADSLVRDALADMSERREAAARPTQPPAPPAAADRRRRASPPPSSAEAPAQGQQRSP